MANPAELLLLLFNRWVEQAGTHSNGVIARSRADDEVLSDHRVAVRYLDQIDEVLGAMKLDGKRVATYRKRFPHWVRHVFAFPYGCDVLKERVSEIDLAVLDNLVDAMDPYVPRMDQGKFESFKTYLDLVEETLRTDDSLSADVVHTGLAFVQNMRTNIDNYAVVGDFGLREALERLLGRLAEISLRSRHRARWKKILDAFVFPYAVSQLPQLEEFGSGIAGLLTD